MAFVRPIRSIALFIGLALLIQAILVAALVFVTNTRPVIVESATYDRVDRQVIISHRPGGTIPSRIHSHYNLVNVNQACTVLTVRQSADGEDVWVELTAGPDHNMYDDSKPAFRELEQPR